MIKPCPFCGGKPQVVKHDKVMGKFTWWAVYCVDKDCVVEPMTGGSTKREALKYWNRRVKP